MRSNTGRKSRSAITIANRRPSAAISGAATRMLGTRRAGRPARLFELDRRDVNVAGGKRDRPLELVVMAVVLQPRLGCGAACPTCSGTVDANDFAPAILSGDDAPFVVPRFGGQFRRKPRRQLAPLGRGENVRGIGNLARAS